MRRVELLGNASLATRIREITDLGRTVTAQLMAPPVIPEKAPSVISMHNLKEFKEKQQSLDETESYQQQPASIVPTSCVVTLPVGASANTAGQKRRRGDSTNGNNNPTAPTSGINKYSGNYGNKRDSNLGMKKALNASGGFKNASISASAVAAAVASTVAAAQAEDDDNNFDDNSSLPDIKRMKREIDDLRLSNAQLIQQQAVVSMQRETELRNEISEEMAAHSAHLLNEIQYLRTELAKYETAANSNSLRDLTRSVKKVHKRQLDLIQDDVPTRLQEAEEEFQRMKAEYQAEIAALKNDKNRLEAELKQYSSLKSLLGQTAAGTTATSTTTTSTARGQSRSKGAAAFKNLFFPTQPASVSTSEVSNPLQQPTVSVSAEFTKRFGVQSSSTVSSGNADQENVSMNNVSKGI
jgi:hypothetical protein